MITADTTTKQDTPMKRHLIYFGAIAAIALALASCQTSDYSENRDYDSSNIYIPHDHSGHNH